MYVESGEGITVGLKLVIRTSVMITGFRYWKAEGEARWHTGTIYNTHSGVAVSSTGRFKDTCHDGSNWVTVPLSRPFKPRVGREYIVALDNVVHFPYTNGFRPYTRLRHLMPISGVFGMHSDCMPTDDSDTGANYWLDGKLDCTVCVAASLSHYWMTK